MRLEPERKFGQKKNDTEKSTIVGKYWIMYRKLESEWIPHSSIYTPLKCAGAYCK